MRHRPYNTGNARYQGGHTSISKADSLSAEDYASKVAIEAARESTTFGDKVPTLAAVPIVELRAAYLARKASEVQDNTEDIDTCED